jgi:hypothetical protein
MTVTAAYEAVALWLNNNQGVLGVATFVVTLVLGWASGIFSALRQKPKFRIATIEGPTYCCTYPTGELHEGFAEHRTGIVLYLSIANVGSAASSIGNISVGYHWDLRPFSIQWVRNSLGWFWLTEQAVALEDFQIRIGENIKVYPFLTQLNALSPARTNTYLDVGREVCGVVYFEQSASWGGFYPKLRDGRVKVRVRVGDVFGGRHTKTIVIPSLSYEEARKFNRAFGTTFASLADDAVAEDSETG